MWENLTRFIHVNRNLSRLPSYSSSVFRLFGVWQWRVQGRGPKGRKKKLGGPLPSPPSLSHGLDPPLFRTLFYLLHPPPRSDELALYRELPTPPTSG